MLKNKNLEYLFSFVHYNTETINKKSVKIKFKQISDPDTKNNESQYYLHSVEYFNFGILQVSLIFGHKEYREKLIKMNLAGIHNCVFSNFERINQRGRSQSFFNKTKIPCGIQVCLIDFQSIEAFQKGELLSKYSLILYEKELLIKDDKKIEISDFNKKQDLTIDQMIQDQTFEVSHTKNDLQVLSRNKMTWYYKNLLISKVGDKYSCVVLY